MIASLVSLTTLKYIPSRPTILPSSPDPLDSRLFPTAAVSIGNRLSQAHRQWVPCAKKPPQLNDCHSYLNPVPSTSVSLIKNNANAKWSFSFRFCSFHLSHAGLSSFVFFFFFFPFLDFFTIFPSVLSLFLFINLSFDKFFFLSLFFHLFLFH
ncbi:unnamed protein product [Acanthosepion pharaonis]|uniref:Uncharacterized protein n=1 Tax=Acanthosepion pharaonis TaxID=158019 RepID=A0A812E6P7_ACAPH|nr:unnamed protein product [Sepia pharaonis]